MNHKALLPVSYSVCTANSIHTWTTFFSKKIVLQFVHALVADMHIICDFENFGLTFLIYLKGKMWMELQSVQRVTRIFKQCLS